MCGVVVAVVVIIVYKLCPESILILVCVRFCVLFFVSSPQLVGFGLCLH